MKLLEAVRVIKWHFILGGYNPPDFRRKPYCDYKESDFIRWAENIRGDEGEKKASADVAQLAERLPPA